MAQKPTTFRWWVVDERSLLMRHHQKNRLIQFIILAFVVYFSLLLAFDGIHRFTTQGIRIEGGVLSGEAVDQGLQVIEGIGSGDGTRTLTIETTKALGLVIHNLAYPHVLSFNGEPVVTDGYAYHWFNIPEGETTIELTGEGARRSFFFVSEVDAMKHHLELRFLINAFLFFLHLLVLTGSLIYLLIAKKKMIPGIFLIFVLSSIVKGINLGELTLVSTALGMNPCSYGMIDGVTTAINNILPIYILLLLFDIHLKKTYTVSLGLLIIPLAMLSQDIFNRYQVSHGIISLAILFLTSLIILYGYVNEKKAALPIMILRAVFLVFTAKYLTVIRNGPPLSNLIFYFNYAYLGATLYFIGISGVVTAFFLQSNRQLALKEKEYERVMLLKGLGHDLKHPVLTAKLNNQLLLEADLKESERESVEISLKALARLDKMIENINDYFNRQDARVKPERMSLKDALKRIEENHHTQTDHRLIVKYAQEDGIIRINPLSFYRIIDNLTDNACKFNEDEKIVTISYEILDDHAIIKVEDNGRGLDKVEIDRVFDVFYRGEESRSVEGLGIGLSVVRQLVEGYHGEIGVQSRKDEGTVFMIKFPIEEFIARE